MLTLGTQRNLTTDLLIQGIIDSVVTVNQFYQMLPFKGIEGNALAYNRESFVDNTDLDYNQDLLSNNKDRLTFTRHSTELTTIIGDAQVNGLIQAVGSDYNDAVAVQVAAKAKGIGREYMKMLVNGNNHFEGLKKAAIQAKQQGKEDTLAYLDKIIDRVHDKDGMVDYLMMNSAGVRKITKAFRNAGTGFGMMDIKTSSGGVMQVQSYRNIPIFRNDFTGLNDFYAGTLDDGSMTHGIGGLTSKNNIGLKVQRIKPNKKEENDIYRIKWYCGLAHFSELGLVRGQFREQTGRKK